MNEQPGTIAAEEQAAVDAAAGLVGPELPSRGIPDRQLAEPGGRRHQLPTRRDGEQARLVARPGPAVQGLPCPVLHQRVKKPKALFLLPGHRKAPAGSQGAQPLPQLNGAQGLVCLPSKVMPLPAAQLPGTIPQVTAGRDRIVPGQGRLGRRQVGGVTLAQGALRRFLRRQASRQQRRIPVFLGTPAPGQAPDHRHHRHRGRSSSQAIALNPLLELRQGAGLISADHAPLQKGAQILGHLAHVRIAPLRLALHGPFANGQQLRRRIRRQLTHGLRRPLHDTHQNTMGRDAGAHRHIGHRAGQELIEHGAHRIHIRVRPHLLQLPLGLLRRHVGRSAHHITIHRQQPRASV